MISFINTSSLPQRSAWNCRSNTVISQFLRMFLFNPLCIQSVRTSGPIRYCMCSQAAELSLHASLLRRLLCPSFFIWFHACAASARHRHAEAMRQVSSGVAIHLVVACPSCFGPQCSSEGALCLVSEAAGTFTVKNDAYYFTLIWINHALPRSQEIAMI